MQATLVLMLFSRRKGQKGELNILSASSSRKINRHQLNYSVVEKETLAMIWALKFLSVALKCMWDHHCRGEFTQIIIP